MYSDLSWTIMVYFFAVIIGLVLLFAQIKMFSIDSNLKKILKILEERKKSQE